jgi:hypothetical protein
VTRREIVEAIQRAASENGGKPLGRERFTRRTGISDYEIGRYWSTWGAASLEAGFEPNALNAARLSDDELLRALAGLARDLGHFPTARDRRIRRTSDPGFPSPNVFENRLGSRQGTLRRLVDFSRENPEFKDVDQMCAPLVVDEGSSEITSGDAAPLGFVYLIRMDKWHKIGCTTDVLRRTGEIRLTLPAKETLVHEIRTDDPYGVERYWHRRFADCRAKGEWFELTAADVRAFKRWRRIA